jgi:hypothetical protein
VTGTTIAVNLETTGTDTVYFQSVIDGLLGNRFEVTQGAQRTITLASGLAAGSHVVELYRETEGMQGVSVFRGFTSGTVTGAPTASGRVVEVVGDSIRAASRLGGEPGVRMDGGELELVPDVCGSGRSRLQCRRLQHRPLRVGHGPGQHGQHQWRAFVGVRERRGHRRPRGVGLQSPGERRHRQPGNQRLGPESGRSRDALRDGGHQLRGNHNELAQCNARLAAVVVAVGDPKVVTFDLGTQPMGENGEIPTGCDWHPNVADHSRMAAIIRARLQTHLGW